MRVSHTTPRELHVIGGAYHDAAPSHIHASSHGEAALQGRFLLDVVVGQSAAIFERLACKDQALHFRWDSLDVLDLGFHIVDGVVGADVQREVAWRRSPGVEHLRHLHKKLHLERHLDLGVISTCGTGRCGRGNLELLGEVAAEEGVEGAKLRGVALHLVEAEVAAQESEVDLCSLKIPDSHFISILISFSFSGSCNIHRLETRERPIGCFDLKFRISKSDVDAWEHSE